MRKDLNKVQLTGRLGADPEIKHTEPHGKLVVRFSVASNRPWKEQEGVAHEDVEWFRVVAWEKLGEICGDYLRKGARVFIEGRLQTSTWEDSASGQTRTRVEVIATDMLMLDAKPGTPDQDAPDEEAAPTGQERPRRATTDGTAQRRRRAPAAADDPL